MCVIYTLLVLLVIVTTTVGEDHLNYQCHYEDDDNSCDVVYEDYLDLCAPGSRPRTRHGSHDHGTDPGTVTQCRGYLIDESHVHRITLLHQNSRVVHAACSEERRSLIVFVHSDRQIISRDSTLDNSLVHYVIRSRDFTNEYTMYEVTPASTVARIETAIATDVQVTMFCVDETAADNLYTISSVCPSSDACLHTLHQLHRFGTEPIDQDLVINVDPPIQPPAYPGSYEPLTLQVFLLCHQTGHHAHAQLSFGQRDEAIFCQTELNSHFYTLVTDHRCTSRIRTNDARALGHIHIELGIPLQDTDTAVLTLSCQSHTRLMDGEVPWQGAVEVLHDNQWKRVCSHWWGNNDARVACRELGYYGGVAHIIADGSDDDNDDDDDDDDDDTQVWLADAQCSGTEESLRDCRWLEQQNHRCGNDTYGAVLCTTARLQSGANPNEGGRVQVFHNGAWRSVCGDDWDQLDAAVVCRELGYPGGTAWTVADEYDGAAVLMDDVNCDDTEGGVSLCRHAGWGNHDCESSTYAAVTCSLLIRIASESEDAPHQGRLEVYHSGVWGVVCDETHWDSTDAGVACTELGYSGGMALSSSSSSSSANGVTWSGRVSCRGTENRLVSCVGAGWRTPDRECLPLGRYAAVTCTAASSDESVTTSSASGTPSEPTVPGIPSEPTVPGIPSEPTVPGILSEPTHESSFTSLATTPVFADSSKYNSEESSSKIIIPVVVSIVVFLLVAAGVCAIIFIFLRRRGQKKSSHQPTASAAVIPSNQHHSNPTYTHGVPQYENSNINSDNQETVTGQTTSVDLSNQSEKSLYCTPQHTTAHDGEAYTKLSPKQDHSRTDDDTDDEEKEDVVMTDNDMYISTPHDERGHNTGQYDDVIHRADQP